MIMTSSPILTPSCRSIAHTPSPSGSPKLRPVASTMAKQPSLPGSSFPLPSSSGVGLSSSLPTRSFVRGPQARPYNSLPKNIKPVQGDTKKFAELVSDIVNQLEQKKRKVDLVEMIENVNLSSSPTTTSRHLNVPKRNQSVSGSLSHNGSWEIERAELIVDIPVWSPGCFQDLSTVHALKDTTLTHTHALLHHLLTAHNTPASYRLLARSCVQPNHHDHNSHHHGWGCIRLAPSISSPISAPLDLKPSVRRASLVHTHSTPNTHSYTHHKSHSPNRKLDHDNCHERVIVESDEEEDAQEFKIKLKEGYSKSSLSNYSSDDDNTDDDEEEEESADTIVGREIEKRGGKEGMVFMMTLFGQPALILT